MDVLPPYSLAPVTTETISPFVYSLRQSTSKTQVLLPFANAPPAVYKITKQRSAALLSSRADFIVTRKGPTAPADEPVSSIRFSRSGELPWKPRAQVQYGADESAYCQKMVSTRIISLEWLVEIDSIPCYWRLMPRPVSLALIELDTNQTLATFTYSNKGTNARGGEEVGKFEICRMDDELRPDLLEQIICSACVVISFGKSMGKFLSNRSTPSAK